MTVRASAKGNLIALEGTGGRSMTVAIRQLERSFRRTNAKAGVSTWDASSIFFQISRGARDIPGPPARALILLYASDLAFRLRWQIRPALEQGIHVVAAPYIESVVGFGIGAGLPPAWLKAVFEFAPPADRCYRVPEATIPQNRRGSPSDSFLEFCFAQLRNRPGPWHIEEIRQGFDQHLHQIEARGKCPPVTRPLLDLTAIAG